MTFEKSWIRHCDGNYILKHIIYWHIPWYGPIGFCIKTNTLSLFKMKVGVKILLVLSLWDVVLLTLWQKVIDCSEYHEYQKTKPSKETECCFKDIKYNCSRQSLNRSSQFKDKFLVASYFAPTLIWLKKSMLVRP